MAWQYFDYRKTKGLVIVMGRFLHVPRPSYSTCYADVTFGIYKGLYSLCRFNVLIDRLSPLLRTVRLVISRKGCLL